MSTATVAGLTPAQQRQAAIDLVLRRGSALERRFAPVHEPDDDESSDEPVEHAPVSMFNTQGPAYDKGVFLGNPRFSAADRHALAVEILRRAAGHKGKTSPMLDKVRKGLKASRTPELTVEQIADEAFLD